MRGCSLVSGGLPAPKSPSSSGVEALRIALPIGPSGQRWTATLAGRPSVPGKVRRHVMPKQQTLAVFTVNEAAAQLRVLRSLILKLANLRV